MSPSVRYSDPYPAEEWEIWYTDTFDRDAPATIDVRGRGLVSGLAELWARHCFETVTAEGKQSFSNFRLRWERGTVTISGDWEGAKRLRHWLFGNKESAYQGYAAEADASLLAAIAQAHARLIQSGHSAEQIVALAVIATDPEDFAERLYTLIESGRR